MIRVGIVDDEPVARAYLRSMIERHDDLEIVCESANGAEALQHVAEFQPELIFLDVQMPGVDGCEFLRRLPDPKPAVVFVTAHDGYAAHAFEIEAVDYLLKPFDRERFEDSLRRIRKSFAQLEATNLERRLRSILDTQGTGDKQYLRRLAVKQREEVIVVPVEEIDWVQSESNYLRIHAGKAEYFIRHSLAALEAALDPGHFARIHRSTIVNLGRVRSFSPIGHGDFRVHLRDGMELTLSRRYRDRLKDAFPEFR